MLREVLLMFSYVIVICCLDALCFPYNPLSLPVLLPLDSLGCQGCLGHVEGGGVHVPLHGAVGIREDLLLGRHAMTPDLQSNSKKVVSTKGW